MLPLEDVSSKYGAPMGRPNVITDSQAPVVFEIERLAWVDGDYDKGGAYWGVGSGKEHMFRAQGESADAVETVYLRADSLEHAKSQLIEIFPNASVADSAELDVLGAAFIQAALWSSHNDRYEENPDDEPEMLDDSKYDLAPEAEAMLRSLCAEFLAAHGDLMEAAKEAGHSIEQCGHDLWLTSNRHGVGFWDRGLAELGEKLSDAAYKLGEHDLYVGDDDLVHVMGDHRFALQAESSEPAGPTVI